MNRMNLFTAAVIALLLVGRNTVKGIGQDLEKGGEAIQKATR